MESEFRYINSRQRLMVGLWKRFLGALWGVNQAWVANKPQQNIVKDRTSATRPGVACQNFQLGSSRHHSTGLVVPKISSDDFFHITDLVASVVIPWFKTLMDTGREIVVDFF